MTSSSCTCLMRHVRARVQLVWRSHRSKFQSARSITSSTSSTPGGTSSSSLPLSSSFNGRQFQALFSRETPLNLQSHLNQNRKFHSTLPKSLLTVNNGMGCLTTLKPNRATSNANNIPSRAPLLSTMGYQNVVKASPHNRSSPRASIVLTKGFASKNNYCHFYFSDYGKLCTLFSVSLLEATPLLGLRSFTSNALSLFLNVRQYSIGSGRDGNGKRLFGSDASNDSSNSNKNLGNRQLEVTDSAPSRSIPMEYIEAIKSEVDQELESPSSLSLPLTSASSTTATTATTSSSIQCDEALFASAKQTEEDFAQYLKGEGDIVNDGTGMHTNASRRQFKSRSSSAIGAAGTPTTTLNDIANFSPSSLSSSSDDSNGAGNDDGILQSSSASRLTSNNEPSSDMTTEDITNNGSNNNDKNNSSSTTEEGTSYYTFKPDDGTLSTPQRHELRRRAIERKLQDQQDQSRATTTSNVQRALTGNLIIAVAKLAAAISSGSSAMLSEFVHSVVDCGNQALLLVGLNSSRYAPDRSHPYGYGKAIYFWALVSALGTFFLGAGVSMTHAVGELMHPSMTTEVTWEVWGVLGMSFVIDGYVFGKTVQGVRESMPKTTSAEGGEAKMSFWKYATTKVRDPATLAVLLEDGAACLGVLLAIGGIGMTHYTGMPVFDSLAGVGISGLLAAMGIALVSVNHRFLIGQGIDAVMREDIEKIILSRRSIDNVYSVQSQWTGPDTFSYKAEVDFDGTFLAAKLMPRYQQEFLDASQTLDRDLRVLLSWYAEDVMRATEREVRHIEEEIRTKYPAAQYIELEPMSKDADRYAIDDGMEAQLRRVEIEVLNRYMKSLYKIKDGNPPQ